MTRLRFVLAHPTHRKNPAPGKLNGVDDCVVLRPSLILSGEAIGYRS